MALKYSLDGWVCWCHFIILKNFYWSLVDLQCCVSFRYVCVLVAQSSLTLCDPWTVAHWAPLSMEFSRQEYWSGLPFPPPGYLPNLGIEPRSPTLQADSLPFEPSGKPSSRYIYNIVIQLYIHIFILFQILFPYKLLQNIE